eukprot:TRINITY_DN9766_c0_g1_i1.p1 TRINITY_DN9766_c0_g1~~TRINITY_DN9766_c0_g1_i1.p1  ORF type:complete len:628 (+),score=146.27 TRINITY_DN9766_c0_g1_i1:19-1902(+)
MKRKEPDNFGPAIPLSVVEFANAKNEETSQPKKKKPKIKHERLFIDMLPCAKQYETSLMHKDRVCLTAVASTDFIITASVDGVVKFWRKTPKGVVFVKQYKSHSGAVTCISVSNDGKLLASGGEDGFIKFYDVENWDMMNMIRVGFVPGSCCWIYKRETGSPIIAVSSSNEDSPDIKMYDMMNTDVDDDGKNIPISVLDIHGAPITNMVYHETYNVVLSADRDGMLEYWYADGEHEFPKEILEFKFKTSTDMYEFMKEKTYPVSLTLSNDGNRFATMGADRKIRIFNFFSATLFRVYDESISVYSNIQKQESHSLKIDSIDFGRRQVVEKKLSRAWKDFTKAPPSNVIFDASGHFVIFCTMIGIKLVNIENNKLVKIIGQEEATKRFLSVSLYQGTTKGSVAEGTLVANSEQDPTIFATAFKQKRFYMFTRNEPEDDPEFPRDIMNERPTEEDLLLLAPAIEDKKIATKACLHTNMGDIHIKLFGEQCPKTVENFTTHSRNNYYNNVIFHRVIRSFMIQTGDPRGDGTGGESIWGVPFEDEFHPDLKHDKPFTVAMANAGENTNGSQFYITTIAPLKHLDNKHTVFGRVTRGMDIVLKIEKVRVDDTDEKNTPLEEIKIINIDTYFE